MRSVPPVRVAQFGCGNWGANLIRNVMANPGAELVAVCDPDRASLQRVGARYPGVSLHSSLDDVLSDSSIDAVIVATPSGMHHEHVSKALLAEKHVFVEKPMSSTVQQGVELVGMADDAGRILMVGHTFLYNNIVHDVKKRIDARELGDIHYAYSQRLNLGRFRQDTDVLWTLAPHDISILNYWFESRPHQVSARGLICIGAPNGHAEVSFAQLDYPDGRSAHLHMSWLDPQKIRQMVLVGSKKMLIYDDMNADRHIQIFDKGVESRPSGPTTDFAEFTARLRDGDLTIPNIRLAEPLAVEMDHFLDCIENGASPLTEGRHGLEVVAVLESLSRSMADGGRPVPVEYPELAAREGQVAPRTST